MARNNHEYHHQVSVIEKTADALVLEIDGITHSFSWRELSGILSRATKEEKTDFVRSPSGYGIHWPKLDEDLSIDGLLGISHAPVKKRGFA